MRVVRSLIAFAFLWQACQAVAADSVSPGKKTLLGLYVTAEEAGRMLENEDVILVDIRSRAEVAFLGLPERVDKHIPFMEMAELAPFDDGSGTYPLERNPDFARDFVFFLRDRGAGGSTKVILMCRSGSRSAKAADVLARMGYEAVYSMVDGFEGDRAVEGAQAGQRVVNGWKNAGLKWTYRISAAQAYDAGY